MSRFPEATAVVAALTAAQIAAEGFAFPALIEAAVTDDGETYRALRCPWCDSLITGDADLAAVDYAERLSYSNLIGDAEFDRSSVSFDYSGDADFGDTLYYQTECCDNPVALPEGWRENA